MLLMKNKNEQDQQSYHPRTEHLIRNPEEI